MPAALTGPRAWLILDTVGQQAPAPKGHLIMYADYAADLNDAVLDTVAARPGLSLAKIAKRLRADAGAVRQSLAYLTHEHYVALRREAGREVYDPAA